MGGAYGSEGKKRSKHRVTCKTVAKIAIRKSKEKTLRSLIRLRRVPPYFHNPMVFACGGCVLCGVGSVAWWVGGAVVSLSVCPSVSARACTSGLSLGLWVVALTLGLPPGQLWRKCGQWCACERASFFCEVCSARVRRMVGLCMFTFYAPNERRDKTKERYDMVSGMYATHPLCIQEATLCTVWRVSETSQN